MASETQVTLIDPHPDAAAWAERRLRSLEDRWSRFLPTSDISLINAHPGQWVVVSEDTTALIHTMQLGSVATGGGYDPTFLHQLLSVGYTSSIDDPDRITIAVDSPSTIHSVRDIEVDGTNVRAPSGVSLDPGGIGKGFAADLVVTELLLQGTAGALVSVGGDIAAAGSAPTPEGWHVRVEDPHRPPNVLATLGVSDGGIATSSTQSRRWLHGGVEQHHVIDPETGTTSTTDLATVTVVATAGWLAEAHATAALLTGSGGVIEYLDAHGLSGLAVDMNGVVSCTADIGAMYGSQSAGVSA